jgi:hypothetical protein
MAANKTIALGPVSVPATIGNLVNPPTVSGGTGLAGTNVATYIIVRQIVLTNATSGSVTVSLYKGASGGNASGTEVFTNATPIPPNSSSFFNVLLRLETTDYLTGIASSGSSVTFSGGGEIGIV